jgi:hypothetical protein
MIPNDIHDYLLHLFRFNKTSLEAAERQLGSIEALLELPQDGPAAREAREQAILDIRRLVLDQLYTAQSAGSFPVDKAFHIEQWLRSEV